MMSIPEFRAFARYVRTKYYVSLLVAMGTKHNRCPEKFRINYSNKLDRPFSVVDIIAYHSHRLSKLPFLVMRITQQFAVSIATLKSQTGFQSLRKHHTYTC
jgi:hypothetical protein